MLVYLTSACFVLVFFILVFKLAIKINRIDLADVIWGPGFIVAMTGGAAGNFASGGDGTSWNRFILVFLVTSIWAIRLSWHIGKRFKNKGQEDQRYLKMRQKWKANWVLNTFLYVYMLQGFLMFIVVSASLRLLTLDNDHEKASLDTVFWIGLLLWSVGFYFEYTSDKQLEQFKSDPKNKGKLITTGLWRYSQHPNYFGEVTLWWGIYLMAYIGPPSLWMIFSPATISYLIIKFSGIPLLKEYLEGRPGYSEYARKTSKFFPMPPKT